MLLASGIIQAETPIHTTGDVGPYIYNCHFNVTDVYLGEPYDVETTVEISEGEDTVRNWWVTFNGTMWSAGKLSAENGTNTDVFDASTMGAGNYSAICYADDYSNNENSSDAGWFRVRQPECEPETKSCSLGCRELFENYAEREWYYEDLLWHGCKSQNSTYVVMIDLFCDVYFEFNNMTHTHDGDCAWSPETFCPSYERLERPVTPADCYNGTATGINLSNEFFAGTTTTTTSTTTTTTSTTTSTTGSTTSTTTIDTTTSTSTTTITTTTVPAPSISNCQVNQSVVNQGENVTVSASVTRLGNPLQSFWIAYNETNSTAKAAVEGTNTMAWGDALGLGNWSITCWVDDTTGLTDWIQDDWLAVVTTTTSTSTTTTTTLRNIIGCSPHNKDCTSNCNLLYQNLSDLGWYYDSYFWHGCKPQNSTYVVMVDLFCDINFQYKNITHQYNGNCAWTNQTICPSYERLGRAVTSLDCLNNVSTGINLTHEFFYGTTTTTTTVPPSPPAGWISTMYAGATTSTTTTSTIPATTTSLVETSTTSPTQPQVTAYATTTSITITSIKETTSTTTTTPAVRPSSKAIPQESVTQVIALALLTLTIPATAAAYISYRILKRKSRIKRRSLRNVENPE